MAAVGSAVGLANGLLQNKIANQEFNSRQAVGNAFQGAVQPDGTVDTGAAAKAIQADPNAAYGAADALAKAAGLQGQNLSNQQSDVAQSQARMNDFYTSLGPLLANGGTPTRSQIIGTATDLLNQGRLKAKDFMAINAEVPFDNKAVPNYAQNKFGSALSASQQASPGPAVATTAGQFTPTAGQFFRGATTGGGGPVARAADGTPVPTDRQGNSVSSTGQKVPNAANQPAGLQTGPAMGTAENLKANIDAYNTDQTTAAQKLANVRNLTTALPLMEQAGTGAAGPGSPIYNQVRSFLVTAGALDPNQTNVNLPQEINKYLYKYVSTNPVADRSNEAQNLAAASSPNLSISMPAAIHLAKSAIGFDRMDAAVTKAYDNAHPNRGQAGPDYLKFKNNFYSSQLDPNAFSYDQMEPDEQRKYVKSLGPKDQAPYQNFKRSIQMAHDTQSLSAPAAQTAPNGGQ
jgi:hypothetical protein